MFVYIVTHVGKEKSGFGLVIRPEGEEKGAEYIGLCSNIKDENKLFKIAVSKVKRKEKREKFIVYYESKKISKYKSGLPRNIEFIDISKCKIMYDLAKELASLSDNYPPCDTVLLRRQISEKKYKFTIELPTYFVRHITYDLELKRKELLEKLKEQFDEEIKKYKTVFTQIKPENYYSDWYWSVIGNNYDLIDPVIPFFEKNDKEHVNIISYLFGMARKEAIDFTNELSSILRKIIYEFHLFYTKNKQKSRVTQLHQQGGFTVLECKNVKYHINGQIFNLTRRAYRDCSTKFNTQEFFQLLWCLITRHKYLNIWNSSMQLSTLPRSLIRLRDRCNFDFELFGSAFNHTYNNYCSLFYDIESYFGSKGSFFRLNAIEGNYYANPPFNINIMNLMADKIIDSLKKTDKTNNLNYYIVLPTWDEKGKKLLQEYCVKYRKFRENYEDNDFNAILKLRNNKYLLKHIILCQDKVQYYSFFEDRNINNVSATSVFLLGKKMNAALKENLIKNTKNIYLLCDHDFKDLDNETIICS